MPRLKQAEVAPFRAAMLAEQGGKCALCQYPIKGDDVLDHDHANGSVRGVLHRGCNAMLGHIENNAPRHKLTDHVKLAKFLAGIAGYLAKAGAYPNPTLYPTFRTDDEKRLLRNKRAKKARQLKKDTG